MSYFAILVAAIVALVVSAVVGRWLVPFLHKIKFGQTINKIGPKWHQNKQGTPTMGGFMFIIGSLAGLVVAYPMLGRLLNDDLTSNLQLVVLGVITTIAFGAVGFIDDYLKVARKQNLGLNARSKLVLQSIIAICFLVSLHLMGRLSTVIMLPFVGALDLKLAFYPIAFIMLVGVVNAANLTDGIDGLASSVTLWAMCGLVVILTFLGNYRLAVWAAAVGGACGGFLVWNKYPAKVFMGDVGSMYLGGAVAVLGFLMGSPELVVLLGLVYIIEAVSVMIQVSYFKLTHGKRLFKMTPIHHHFEMSGWSETKIVAVFSGAEIICVILAILYSVFVL